MITSENLCKEWKKLLIENEISATELFKRIGINQAGNNRKIKNGTIRLLEFVEWLQYLGYGLEIVKKEAK